MPKCRKNQVVLDVGALGFLAAEEFAPGWEVEEQGPDFNGGTAGACGSLHLGDPPTLEDDLGPFSRGFVTFTCGQRETADARNRGKGFAPEAHGGDGCQVFGLLDL